MVQTRAQERSAAQGSKPTETARRPKQISKSKTATEKKKVEENKVQDEQMEDITTEETNGEKRKREEEKKEEQKPEGTKTAEKEEPPNKTFKASPSEIEEEGYEDENEMRKMDESIVSRIHKIIDEFGRLPLEDIGVSDPLQACPETILAMVIDAMLKSTRISHILAQKAVKNLIDAGYNDIKKLSESTWDDRVELLAEAGYNRYREHAANNLGALIEFVNEKYGMFSSRFIISNPMKVISWGYILTYPTDGDLNNLYQKADQQPAQVRVLIKQIKGLGDVGVDIFFNNAQSVWRTLAPFIDTRSLRTADEVGIGTDVDAIYEALKYDPVQISRLANGLSAVRLEHKQGEVSEEE